MLSSFFHRNPRLQRQRGASTDNCTKFYVSVALNICSGPLRSRSRVKVLLLGEDCANQRVAPPMVHSAHPREVSSLDDEVSLVGEASPARGFVSRRLQEADDARRPTRSTPAPSPPPGWRRPRWRPWTSEDILDRAEMPPAPAPLQTELEEPLRLFLRTVNIALVRNGPFLHVAVKDAMTLKGLLRQLNELDKPELPTSRRQEFKEYLESEYQRAVAQILNPQSDEEARLLGVMQISASQRTLVMQKLSSTTHDFREEVYKTLRTEFQADKGVAPPVVHFGHPTELCSGATAALSAGGSSSIPGPNSSQVPDTAASSSDSSVYDPWAKVQPSRMERAARRALDAQKLLATNAREQPDRAPTPPPPPPPRAAPLRTLSLPSELRPYAASSIWDIVNLPPASEPVYTELGEPSGTSSSEVMHSMTSSLISDTAASQLVSTSSGPSLPDHA